MPCIPLRLCCDESLTFVFMPMGAEFTERALALAAQLLPTEGEAAAWRQQVGAAQLARAGGETLMG